MVKNPRANYVERIHQTLGNMIRTHELENRDFDKHDPWSGILASCAWAIRSTISTVTGATPAQIVFGRDMLIDWATPTDWTTLKRKRQAASSANTNQENKKRKEHIFQAGDKVLVNIDGVGRKLMANKEGPYEILQVYDHGMLRIRRGAYEQKVPIRNCVPYFT